MHEMQIDGQRVFFEPGDTILQSARKAAIEIPSLCSLGMAEPKPSCMICTVGLAGSEARFVPACATKSDTGMVIE